MTKTAVSGWRWNIGFASKMHWYEKGDAVSACEGHYPPRREQAPLPPVSEYLCADCLRVKAREVTP